MARASYDELARLCARAQDGDAEAFAELHGKTAPILRLTIASKVGFAEAEDILQETYLVAWDNLAKIDPQSVVAYLNATARNLCSNHLRRKGTRDAASLQDDAVATMAESANAWRSENPADALETADTSRRLREALASELDDQERTALLLHHVLGLTNEETAAQMGVSERTAKRIVARALAALRRKLTFVPTGAELAAAAGASSAAAPAAEDLRAAVGDAERRWGRTHQIAAVAAALAVLAVGVAATLLPTPPAPEPPLTPTATTEPNRAATCEETWSEDGFTWVRLAIGTHPVERVWCTDASGAVYAPQQIADSTVPLSAFDENGGTTSDAAHAGVYVFDLPTGTYELHAKDTAGNESHGPLEVVQYPEP